jgi:cell division protein FtsQ
VSTGTRPAPPPRRAKAALADAAGARPTRDPAGTSARASRRRVRLLLVIAVVVALAALAYGATISPFLDVDKVVVRGEARTTAVQLQHAAGIHPGDPLFWLSTGDAVSSLEAVPFVRRARVVKEWPDTVRITVTERTPVAWADRPTGHVTVDATGRVLETVPQPPAGLPQLVGLTAVPAPGGTIAPAGPARAAGVLPTLAAAGTKTVTVADGNLSMQLVSGAEVRLGDASMARAKVRAALAVLASTGDQPVHYVDVSVPTNPVAG